MHRVTDVTDDEKFLFDLQGFLVLRGAIEPELIEALDRAVVDNEAIEHDDSWAEGLPVAARKHLPDRRQRGVRLSFAEQHADHRQGAAIALVQQMLLDREPHAADRVLAGVVEEEAFLVADLRNRCARWSWTGGPSMSGGSGSCPGSRCRSRRRACG